MTGAGRHWLLVTYTTGDVDDARLGILLDGELRSAPAFAPPSMLELLEVWPDLTPKLRSWDPLESSPVEEGRLLAPIRYPSKVLCAGANYYAHLEEMGIARPDQPGRPYFFLKPPTTAVIGPDEDVILPRRPDRFVDWEGELAIVIGRHGRHLSPEEARHHVAGWTVIDDITSRDRLRRTDTVSEHFGYDWLAAKGEDTSCPMGPGVLPGWFVSDPQDLHITLSVNGTVKQDSSTADMIIPAWELVAAASELTTLEPGDVIATGSPAGVGVARGERLEAGDVVEVRIDGIGRIRNRMVEQPG